MITVREMNKIQSEIKNFLLDFGIYFFRVITGGWIAIVIAHLLQILFDFKLLSLFLIVFLITGIMVYITRKKGGFFMIILNLFFILIGVLFEMYIELVQIQVPGGFSVYNAGWFGFSWNFPEKSFILVRFEF